jgi:hypothetical protein
MEQGRRLSDDRVGAPRWGRWFVYVVLGVMWVVTVTGAVVVPYMAYRLADGVWAAVLAAVLEIAALAFAVAMRRSARLRRWYSGRDDGELRPDLRKHRHWDRFMP